MYNVDDAIAKIDGYVISISGGGPFVGEKKLIRIDEVKRTAAYASLISGNGGGQADEVEDAMIAEEIEEVPDGSGEGEQVQSNGSKGKRRRGRRGGRRRSRARPREGSGSTS